MEFKLKRCGAWAIMENEEEPLYNQPANRASADWYRWNKRRAQLKRMDDEGVELIYENISDVAKEHLQDMEEVTSDLLWTRLEERMNIAASAQGRNRLVMKFNRTLPVRGRPMTEWFHELRAARAALSGTDQKSPQFNSIRISFLIYPTSLMVLFKPLSLTFHLTPKKSSARSSRTK